MRRKRSGEAKLNITSLLDMFTIMLLFLLVNFSAEQEKATLHQDVRLPVSTAELDSIDAVDVVLTKEALILEDKVILKLSKKGKFPKQALDGDKIKPYYEALLKIKKKNEGKHSSKRRRHKKDKHQKREDVILFQADKAMAFNMIDKIMMTTAEAGFPNFKFAVLQESK